MTKDKHHTKTDFLQLTMSILCSRRMKQETTWLFLASILINDEICGYWVIVFRDPLKESWRANMHHSYTAIFRFIERQLTLSHTYHSHSYLATRISTRIFSSRRKKLPGRLKITTQNLIIHFQTKQKSIWI